MSMLTPHEKEKLFTSIERIERGMFGDDKLKQPGLVSDVDSLKKWRHKMSLRLAFIGGAAATIWEGVKWCAEWLVQSNQPKG